MRMEEKQRKPSDPEDVCTYLNIVHTKYTCICVHVCAWVCMCVHGCTWVYVGVHGCVWGGVGYTCVGCSCLC